ncbi:hypothetical protein NX059_007614 [Plenodomus lindquistii]|nr:hypothetical protein NX059_007614 [Plenodomus lindquistii]
MDSKSFTERTDDIDTVNRLEHKDTQGNLAYHDDAVEPELHWKTWVAFFSICTFQIAALSGLTSVPAILTYMVQDLGNSQARSWIPTSLSLTQAALAPILSSASDLFQARKYLLVGASAFGVIGSAIAPGSQSLYRVIVAQVIIGIGFSALPLGLSVPSEIMPRRWRPVCQGIVNSFAWVGAVIGTMAGGAFVQNSNPRGWRNLYWLQLGLWAFTGIGILAGYNPPKRHTRFDHLSVWDKTKCLDLPGAFLLTAGLVLLLTGLNLGDSLYTWQDVQTLATLVLGVVLLVAFCVYEWKGTKNGVANHEMFKAGKSKRRLFVLCLILMFIEAVMFFATTVFYPIYVSAIITREPIKVVAYLQPGYAAGCVCTILFGLLSTRLRSIRSPMAIGFVIWTGAMVGFATLQPGQAANSLAFCALAGIGLAAPLGLIIAGVQLAVPHSHIAGASAIVSVVRAAAGAIFTAIYFTTFEHGIASKLPAYVARAVAKAGLMPQSIPSFVKALAGSQMAALPGIAGVTPQIIGAGVAAQQQAYADSIRPVYYIAAAFGAFAVVLCYFIGPLASVMTYEVDAPVEELHAKVDHSKQYEMQRAA